MLVIVMPYKLLTRTGTFVKKKKIGLTDLNVRTKESTGNLPATPLIPHKTVPATMRATAGILCRWGRHWRKIGNKISHARCYLILCNHLGSMGGREKFPAQRTTLYAIYTPPHGFWTARQGYRRGPKCLRELLALRRATRFEECGAGR